MSENKNTQPTHNYVHTHTHKHKTYPRYHLRYRTQFYFPSFLSMYNCSRGICIFIILMSVAIAKSVHFCWSCCWVIVYGFFMRPTPKYIKKIPQLKYFRCVSVCVWKTIDIPAKMISLLQKNKTKTTKKIGCVTNGINYPATISIHK